MTIIVGIGVTEPVAPMADLLAALRLDAGPLCLVHAVEPLYVPSMGMTTGPLIAPDILVSVEDERSKSGEAALKAAAQTFADKGLEAICVSSKGLAADVMMEEASARGARLLVLGSERKSLFDSLLIGSVGRRLASAAQQSVLLVRQVRKSALLTVVIATDHSDYADRAISAFLTLRPQSIGKVILVSALDTQMAAAGLTLGEGVLISPAPDRQPEIETRTAALAERVGNSLGCQVETRVVREPPIPVIASTCADSGADLLVLGAKGHGLLHRVLLGSLAMHFVLASPCSLLLMRA